MVRWRPQRKQIKALMRILLQLLCQNVLRHLAAEFGSQNVMRSNIMEPLSKGENR